MGNTIGGKKRAKIMKINGETMKFKTPIQAKDVVKDYPGYVVLESDSVKHYGIRAKPLDSFHNLEPNKLYFLVELPKFPNDHNHRVPRKVRSGIHMSAKNRLENLMLAKRSMSDLSGIGHTTRVMVNNEHHDGSLEGGEATPASGLRLKMKLPKAEMERLMSQNLDQETMTQKIMDLCLRKNVENQSIINNVNEIETANVGDYKGKEIMDGNTSTSTFLDQSLPSGSRGGYNKKRVGFVPVRESEIRLAVAS